MKRAVLFTLLAACAGTPDSGGDAGNPDSGTPPDAGATATRTLELQLDGDPNGLLWDATAQTLYIADNANNRILTWTEAGLGMPLALPPAPADGPGLGQVAQASDGRLLSTRFGYGTSGAVLFARTNGDNGIVPSLDPMKRRIGIVTDGTDIYDSYFVLAGTRVGAIAKVTLDGTEVDVMQGLSKPVGLLVQGGVLYAADQMAGEILKCTLPACTDKGHFATLSAPDLLSSGPNGSFFSGSPDGNVYQISGAGTVQALAGTFHQPRGTAYDAANKRLFIADHDPAGPMGYLRIIPIE
jgi:hypothetical protein